MVDKIRALQVFSQVAQSGSFTAAAGQLGVSKATVTKDVLALEEMLGARLFNRTTKQVRLTDVGAKTLQGARDILAAYESLEVEARSSVQGEKGILRIGAPPAFASHQVTPLIVSFTRLHTDIQVVLTMDDGTSNLVSQGLDLSIRISPRTSNDSSDIAVPLMHTPQVTVASPAYLKQHGTPLHPRELAGHNCLTHTIKSPTRRWEFMGQEGPVSVRVAGNFHSNLGEPLMAAALQGHGIAIHPYFMVEEHITRGQLVPLMPGYPPAMMQITIIYPTRKNLPLRARRFIDHVKAWASTPPVWAAQASPLESRKRVS